MAGIRITLSDLKRTKKVKITGEQFFSPFSNITIDSRLLDGKDCFVAIKGEKFDGHTFTPEVIKAGIKVIFCNNDYVPSLDYSACFISVPDTTLFLSELAVIKRAKFKGAVIGITGSNGKTTTKEILKTILSEKFNVHATEANNNNHIGVPLTIFGLETNHQVAVIEMGTNHFGEIEYLAKMISPDIAIITNIGPSHLEFLKDLDGVFNEKRALFEETIRVKGTLIVNKDDKYLKSYIKKNNKVISYGQKNADVTFTAGKLNGDGTQRLKITTKKFNLKIDSPLIGSHNASNIASAAAVAVKLELKKKEIREGIRKLQPAKHRLNFIKSGLATIIDDTYNSNPNSVKAALKVLTKVAGKEEKVVALGDMFELGATSEQAHRKLALPVAETKPSLVLLLGKEMRYLFDELKPDFENVFHFENREEYAARIRKLADKKMYLLVKGSRGMRMEEFISELMKV